MSRMEDGWLCTCEDSTVLIPQGVGLELKRM